MKFSCASLLFVALLPLTLSAQVELIAGWNFGQFISAGVPSTDGTTGAPVGRIPSNFTQEVSPVDADSGPNHISSGVAEAFAAGSGLLRFDGTSGSHAWDVAGASDIVVVELGALEAVNHELVNGRTLFPGDPNNAHLRLVAGVNRRVALTLSTLGFSDYDPASTPQTNDANLTFAAYAASGGTATLSWSLNGVMIGAPITVQSGPFQAFALDLPAEFYGQPAAVLLFDVSGDVVIDHLQVNGLRATAPVFTQQPLGATVTAGANVSFTVAVSGAASPTYRWRFNGEDIADGPGVSGATTPVLSLTGVTARRAGAYTVRVENNGARAESAPALLVVNVPPAILLSPASATANPGGSIVFEVVASGSPAPTYRWRRGAVELIDDGRIIGSATPVLTLAALTLADAGDYTVVVTNPAGSVVSAGAALSITEQTLSPTIQRQPLPATVALGETALFRVDASGAPAPTIQWFRGDEPLVNGSGITGALAATLRVTPTSISAAGEYRARITNTAGVVWTDAVSLTVLTAPTIPAGPAGQTVTAGGRATFSVSAAGIPAPTYQWRKNGEPLAGETRATLTIDPVLPSAAGDYTVVVTNTLGSVESGVAALVVNRPPVITLHPLPVAVGAGGTARFTVIAEGQPAPAYQWLRNGQAIPDATDATLTLADVQPEEAGDYSVVARNVAGSETSRPARLEVAIRVLRASAPQVFAPGSRLELDSRFAAAAGFRFQWLRNGKPLPGATAPTLLIDRARNTDSGTYTLQVFAASGRRLQTLRIAVLRISVAATYDGLVRDLVSQEPLARIQVAVADGGGFTAQLAHEDGRTYTLKGQLTLSAEGHSGEARVTVKRKAPLGDLSAQLELDARARSFVFTLSGGGMTLGRAEAVPRVASTETVPWSGSYALELAPLPSGLPDQPTRKTTLLATVSAKGGLMKISGTLADGTRVNVSVPASAFADYAIWIPLDSGRGRLAGALRFEPLPGGGYAANAATSGAFVWLRPANANAKTFPGGIDLLLAPSLARP